MLLATSQMGVDVDYKCYRLPDGGRRCKDKYTDKCYCCKYCKAVLSAKDVAKLIIAYKKLITISRKEG